MKINIFGSTGIIGRKTLELIDNNFPNIKINLLCAKSNSKLLKSQIYKYKPKYAFLYDHKKFIKFNNKINNTILLNYEELLSYLISSKSNLSILAISGYKSLYFLESIIENTDNLGLVSKEAIVSAGHIFRKKKYFKKTNIYPLDSEHFSLFEYFERVKISKNIKTIILTASGGPFYNKRFKSLENIKFSEAINHPKWKMGYKNSIDSATLVNKCLELIEAHYLFNLPFEKLDILIHPESQIHSIFEYNNYIYNMVAFQNDMLIPIYNFLNQNFKYTLNNHKFNILNNNSLNFSYVTHDEFPIYNFFNI